ncbi:MAG: glycosyltransferase family 1 protein, partial [Ilumatobacter sp.]
DEAHPDVDRAGRVLRRAVEQGATVVTSSTATSDRVREILAVEPVTIRLGPPLTPATTVTDRPPSVESVLETTPFVLSIGTAERRKNLPRLIDAFARLGTEHESVRLVLAGRDGDDAGAVARALARLDPAIRHRVHRMTTVDDAAKHWLLHHATALAYPSLDEGFGFPILEAQLAGTPVVASSAGSIPEIGGSAVLLSLPSDVDALAANLYWVLTSESQRDRLIRLGRRNVERFSWDSTARDLRTLYHRLAEEA